ncbi:MAG: ParA family protein [archaeon]|nr:ParA family protein [archaeon]
MKTICFYNHKGGVGKTTLTAAIAGELITKGKKVILVDTDSQANLTSQFYPADPDSMEYELADYLYDNSIGITNIVCRTKYDGLFLVPCKKLSAGGKLDKWARGEATEIENRNAIKNFISELATLSPDFILFDMPPSYSELDKKVLLGSDEVIPVLQIDKYSIDGLSDFFLLLTKLKSGDPKPVLEKLIFNNYDKRKAVQKSLITTIDELTLKKYKVPNDEIFKKAALQQKAVQALDRMKPDTTEVLETIVNDIIGEK